MLKLICVAMLCVFWWEFAWAQNADSDEYVTGMTILGKRDSNSSCPPIVWIVEPDTPAAKAGIRPGDRLLEVDGQSATDITKLRPLLRTKDAKPSTMKFDGEHGSYFVSVGRIKASTLYGREGWKLGPDGGLYRNDATEAEMQRVSKMSPEPPASEKVFSVDHYPANLELYYPGFEIFVWKAPKTMTVGAIENGPAQTAGVHYGDAIVSVNGVNPGGKSMAELERLFSSPKPATMTLVIDRDSVIKTFIFELGKASEVAATNYKRMYEGRMIPSVVTQRYLHCFELRKSN